MATLVLWCGPVRAENLGQVRWAESTSVVTINRGPDPSSPISSASFRAIAEKIQGDDKLAKLVKSRAGLDLDKFRSVVLSGFSAGHGLLDALLLDPPTLDRTTVLASFDAYYTGLKPGLLKGYLEIAKLSRWGPKFFWASTSGYRGAGYLSGSESIEPFLSQLTLLDSHLPLILTSGGELMPPFRVLEGGHVLYADWALRLSHIEHATLIAPVVMERLVSPAIVEAQVPIATQEPGAASPASSSWWWPLIPLGLGAIGGVLAARGRK